MADTALTSPDAAAAPAGRPLHLPKLFGGRGRNAIRTLGLVVVLASVFMSVATFLMVTGATPVEPLPQLWTPMWIINAVLILAVIALVVTEAILLVQSRVNGEPGARLTLRMVGIFAFAASVPAVLVAVVAMISLNQGLDQWFSERTRTIVESSRVVARSYMREHHQVLRDDIIYVANELEQAHQTYEVEPEKFQRILTALAITRSLPFTSLITKEGQTLMRAQINVQASPPPVPQGLTEGVLEGIPAGIEPGRTNLVGSVIKLRGYDDIYLFVARPVDPEVLEFMRLTDDNISEYRQYASNRLVFQITFTIMYVGLAVVLLLAALWIGIALANRFVDPIRNLILAASRVSRGDLDIQVPVEKSRGDMRDLSNRFNRMTQQLKQQREALISAGETNEKRRQFTEAVVAGVSAGIVGLDAFGNVTLINGRASEMLDATEIDMVGKRLGDRVEVLNPIIEKAQANRRSQTREQVEIGSGPDYRTYQVQITREGSITESKGFVVTLDDITDLLSAQRTGAWADVARRIAHEIKNPLTPIQLSAERLRRRYASKLVDDFEVFDKCVNTIVRQVGDIGRMVDEFSSFARMPAAAPVRGDIADAIRQAVFLESVRLPEVAVTTDLPDGPLYAQFDPHLIAQVLTNLIKNAVEAFETTLDSVQEPLIAVSARREGNMVRVSVTDNGKGWPKENRQRLLEPYMTTREKGTGLGLAIVARIIEQHGGTVELIDAEPDTDGRIGACFTFTLPTGASADVPEQADTEAMTEGPLAAAADQ